MAAGFSESYIRVWNLTGAQMPGLENSSEANEVMDGMLEFFSCQSLPQSLTSSLYQLVVSNAFVKRKHQPRAS